jgi:hypothetical protein
MDCRYTYDGSHKESIQNLDGETSMEIYTWKKEKEV